MTKEILRRYNADPNDVFNSMVSMCKNHNLTIKEINQAIWRIKLSTPLSLVSWGENYSFFIDYENNVTQIYFEGSPKLFYNITGHKKVNSRIVSIIKELDHQYSQAADNNCF